MNLEYALLGAAIVLIAVLAIVLLRRRRPAPAPSAPSKPEPEPVAFLERTGEGEEPRIHSLHKPLVIIGRGAENDIRIPADLPGALSVSRRHAQVRREDLDFIVEDLGSQNGIRVNGLATCRNLLRDGYRVSFGSVEFVFRTPAPPEAAESDS
jgi:hypothetical protein